MNRKMNRKIAFTALSLAIMLGGVSGALAAGKKHSGHEAYASAGVTDPRQNTGGIHEKWCDVDPQCNGWALWLQEVKDGKLKN